MSQEEAKLKIAELIKKYESIKANGQLAHFSEEDTKTNFIIPLFVALGWNMHDRDEVTAEEQISGQRVDYGFYHEGHIKFYLEAKPLKAELHQEKFAQQAIRYSWNKGVTWAILTDFESLIVFNALSPEKALHGKKYFEIPYSEYLGRFDQLRLLSKEAFSKNLLDQEAEKHGKKLQKVSVTENLSKDLNECRELLTNAFQTCNHSVASDLIDEGVQKLLDRLIFIRVAEDRKIEPLTLRPLINQWIANGRQASPYIAMVEKFRELDAVYNSNLFSEHPFEKWEEFADATEKVVDILYGKKSYFEYDFSVIPADVLGSVYENYLGYKMQKAPKKTTLFGDVAELSKDARKRKEHGIYYTPKFIVRYIVEHALGPVLDRCQSISDLQKIKVLDPACGSGSFLVAALDLILKKYESFGRKPDGLTKVQILQSNLYGVDLDQQAVELARLNLLLQTFDEQVKLPNLGNNIKNGNSLISGTDKELKKFFGKNFRDKNPFNWEEEFPEVFKQGGFDVVIGNPPWGANIDQDAKYLAEKFPNSTKAHKDTYKIFIDLSLSKLNQFGKLGFVVPNTFLYQPRYQDIKDALDKHDYLAVNLGEKVFSGVDLPCCALIVDRKEGSENLIVDLTKADRTKLPTMLSAVDFDSARKEMNAITSIIKNTGITFDDVFFLKDAGIQYASVGAGKSNKGKSDLPKRIFQDQPDLTFNIEFYTGSNIVRGGWLIEKVVSKWFRENYKDILKKNEWVHFTKEIFDCPKKIVWRQTADTIHAAIMDFPGYFGKTIHAAVIKPQHIDKFTYEYALAIFNSQYIDYIYRQKVFETGKVFPQVKLKYLRDLPFILGKKEDQNIVSNLAKKMIDLNNSLRNEEENSEKWLKIKSEIEKTDRKIDQEVYRLYGLTEEEIKIVEGK